MSELFEWVHTVSNDEIDELGHANNLAYVRWMQLAAVAHSTHLSWSPVRYKELGSGWVVRSHQIKYIKPAFAKESILVKTWVSTMERVTSLRNYEIFNKETSSLLATANTLWAFTDYTKGRPVRIPEQVKSAYPVKIITQ